MEDAVRLAVAVLEIRVQADLNLLRRWLLESVIVH